ncbi:MAG TPA: sensor histidine kinase [Verrucomicrobiae bacterium]|jgi:signal transduction histidine kinase|nr:sensor histidine kinase [Verrucomicrobiae bacterium]
MPFSDKKTLMYYVIAVLAAIAALLLREVLGEAYRAHYPYHTVWLAVIFVAWYCGIGPSILAVAIDALGIWYWFLPPYHSFFGKNRVEWFGIVGFLLFSYVIIALGESNRRLFLKRTQAEEALQAANESLEARVRERTLELQQSNDSARRLSARILSLQDEERRHIARGLHDSLGQYLSALKLDLDTFTPADARQTKMIAECSDIVQQCLTETRTISHLLHPPLLDERGFSSATRLYVDGFSRRSGVSVKLDLPDSETRLPHNVEIALFRAVQEALTNIHRHSGASAVDIYLAVGAAETRLTIKDNGKGIAPEALRALQDGTTDGGVGIAGMRERLRDLCGLLEIQSNSSGTTIVIAVPTIEEKQPTVIVA